MRSRSYLGCSRKNLQEFLGDIIYTLQTRHIHFHWFESFHLRLLTIMQATLNDLLKYDYYQLFQIDSNDVNKDGVKRKYRQMILKYHPN